MAQLPDAQVLRVSDGQKVPLASYLDPKGVNVVYLARHMG